MKQRGVSSIEYEVAKQMLDLNRTELKTFEWNILNPDKLNLSTHF